MMEGFQPNKKQKMTESSRAPNLFSSPSSSTGNNYHVFLSFHGSDTRKGFTDHLYRRLVSVGATFMFRDEESLPIGEEIHGQLLDAIGRSKISIPIISENYASSEWCLMELVEMMERKESSGHIVLPIFYKVKPANVKRQEGNFGKAFHSFREKFERKARWESAKFKSEKWKKVLADVCSLKGWESERFHDGHEGKLVDEVVGTVLTELGQDFQLMVSEHLVGTDDRVEKIMGVLDSSSKNSRVIGLYGMSGVGKTTLAKLVYNRLSRKFRYCSFVAHIQASIKSNSKCIEHLQSQLIHNLLGRVVEVSNVDEGSNMLRSGLKEKDVLIFLDDVGDEDQLKALFGEYDWYSSRSRIIITTQNCGILKLDNFVQYEVDELTGDQPLLLFSRYAFKCESPPREFEKISRQIVTTTGGLPLALQVIGSLLHKEKDQEVWGETLCKLRNIPADKVKEKLKLSYDTLDHCTQQIFLDIACFFIGINKRSPICMWDSCEFYPNIALRVLMQRSLIKIGEGNEIQMHDQLRAVGRELVREEDYYEPKNRSRLWDSDEVLKVLEGNEASEKVRYICMRNGSICCKKEQFEKLKNLRMLRADNLNLVGDFQNLLLELRWLRCRVDDMSSEVTNFYMKKLVILELSGDLISEDWIGWSSIKMVGLEVLKLSSCSKLQRTPNLSSCENLKVLKLKDCRDFEQFDSSIRGLKKLVSLKLCNCPKLKVLPEELGSLMELKELIVDDCGSLVHIPDLLGHLLNLSTIQFSGCPGLVKLPDSIGNLTRLERLKMESSGLRETPNSIGRLTALIELDLNGTKITDLPKSIGYLQNLKELHLFGSTIGMLPKSIGKLGRLQVFDASLCSELKGEIPSQIGELSSLKTLDLFRTGISALPDTICNLSSLQCLDLSSTKITELPESIGDLQNLKELHLGETMIGKLPKSIGSLRSLKVLDASFCSELKGEIPSQICELSSLETLDLSGTGISILPDTICNLSSLQCLVLSSTKITELPESIGDLQNLKELRLRGSMIGKLPKSIGRLGSLQVLDAWSCSELKGEIMSQICELSSLETLNLHQTGITALPDTMCNLSYLQHLNLSYTEITELPEIIGDIQNLKELHLGGSTIVKLPKSIRSLRSLQLLEYYSDLKGEIPSQICDLSSLETLHLCGTGISTLPDTICNLSSLQCLDLSSTKITELPESIGDLQNLKELHLGETTIGKLPRSIGRLGRLQVLEARSCFKLKGEIPSQIGALSSLETLDLHSTGISALPDTICNLSSLQCLDLSSTKIMKLPESIGDLQNLKELHLGETTIGKLPKSIGRLGRLQVLEARSCSELNGEILSQIGALSSLETLDLRSTGISTLPDTICNLFSLQSLQIEDCHRLQSLPKVPPNLTSLELTCQSATLPQLSHLIHLNELTLNGCSSLECLPELSSSLFHLTVRDCNKLKELPNLSNLKLLQNLCLSHCSELIEIVGLEGLKSLTQLDVSECTKLSKLDELDKLKYLNELDISRDQSIGSLDLSELTSLRILHAHGCEHLSEIRGLHNLEFLEELNICGCRSIESLPDLSCFNTLKKLNINNCVNLRDIQCLEKFSSCRVLYIMGCQSLAKFPDLSRFENLKEVTVKDCPKLLNIFGFEKLRSLEEFNISGCKSIQTLPDLSTCDKLQSLVVEDCEKLIEISGVEKLDLSNVHISKCDSLKLIPKYSKAELILNNEEDLFDEEDFFNEEDLSDEEEHFNEEDRCIEF